MKQVKLISAFMCLAICFLVGEARGYAKATTITPGVQWESTKPVISQKVRALNTLRVNLNNPYTTVQLGVSEPFNQKAIVTSLAKARTSERHQVVGAVNASFFHMSSGNPMYLVATGNKLTYLGTGAGNSSSYMYKPAAFGMTADKKAIIDTMKLDITIQHQNQSFKIDTYNTTRGTNQTVLYTKSYGYSVTNTNSTGYEVVVSKLPKNVDHELTFGEAVSGVVTAIRPYGQSKSSGIPKDGFVLSAHGTAVNSLKKMKIGDSVSITMNKEAKWKNANFIMASGPLLVQNGKTNMTINAASSRATARTARTAVAVDKTGKQVFLVTVDVKKGSSAGMTLKEFADYLVKMGAYKAINLDGGGSTAMAARIPGNQYATLVNAPSGGSQRAVSTILEVVSTAPTGAVHTFSASPQAKGNFLVGGSTAFTLKGLDAYNNPVAVAQATYSVKGGIGVIQNAKFVARKAGTGTVTVKAGKGTATIPITVESAVTKLTSNVKAIYVGRGISQKVNLTAYGKNNKALIFNHANVKWTVKGGIGTVSADGTFTAGQKEGKGSITASLGGKQLTILVTVSNQSISVHSLDTIDGWKTASARAKTSLTAKNDAEKKEGKGYLALSYDFIGEEGVSASYLKPANSLSVPNAPTSLTIWAYGDGQKNWLRGKVVDANGKEHTISFTEEYAFNWTGWKQVSATIPKGVAYPITLESIYVAQGNTAYKAKGTIFFDHLIANYN